MIRQGKGNPEAIRSLQRDIDKVAEQWRTLTTVNAKSYGQLTAGNMSAEEFTRRTLAINLPEQCDPQPQSASGSAACGTASAIFQATANYERFVQIACHLGARLPELNTGALGSASRSSSMKVATNDVTQVQSESRESQQLAQQQSQQAQQTAQQNQSRADQERQGKRKTHDPAAEAHECISIDKAGSGNFGAFKNQCPYPVNFTTCNEKPRIIQGGFNWSADFDCAKQQFGLHTPKGNSSVAAHNRSTEFVYWFACKAPAMPVDATYVAGKGIEARCHN
jgi:hypothetical protein